MEGAFLEAEPNIGVKVAGFFKSVFGEIEDDNLTAGFEDAVSMIRLSVEASEGRRVRGLDPAGDRP